MLISIGINDAGNCRIHVEPRMVDSEEVKKAGREIADRLHSLVREWPNVVKNVIDI